VARSRFRSVRYDLEAALAVARVVDNAGGSITPDLLAVALGYSGTNNGTYLTRLANAKLFGVVGGRGSRVELTDRGRLILAGQEPSESEARREAFLAVPLFRAVFETLPTGALAGREEMAAWLSERFGEPEDKAPLVAAKLLDSAHQARVTHLRRDGKYEVSGRSAKFTVVENLRPGALLASVVKSRRTRSVGRSTPLHGVRGDDVDENQMWLDEEPQARAKGAGRVSRGRRIGVIAAAVACVAVVVVPLSVALTGNSAVHPSAQAPKHHHAGNKATTLGNGPAEHEVLGALSATTDSNNFDFDYSLSSTAPTSGTPTTTTTTVCHTVDLPETAPGTAVGGVAQSITVSPILGTVPPTASGAAIASSSASASSSATKTKKAAKVVVSSGSSGSSASPPGTQTATECTGGPIENPGSPVTGSGVSNINPKATLIDATVGSGLTVTLRVDGTELYEDLSNLETSLAPPANMADSSGQPISGFASITESTIGQREGAIAMLGMASPTGYLDLYQQDIDGATQTGTSTVNGVPVTVYQVAVDPTQLVNDPSITSEESTTATAAIGVLNAQGYSGTTDDVSIDNSGFIREVKSVAHFSDGGTVVLDVTLSNFGCAGTVLMPGQQGPGAPPSGCTSPDTGAAATTTTTTTTLAPATQSSGTQSTGTGTSTPPTTATTTSVPATSTTTVVPTTTQPTDTTTTSSGNPSG
jgi:hypothetical protein